jgi:hypothetical protein
MSTESTTPTEPSYRAERTEDHVVVRFPTPRRFLRSLLPEETRKHLYAAQREQLLALRSIVDAAIERVVEEEKKTSQRID